MSDLISRQAAIDALENQKDKNAKGDIGGFYNTIIQHDIDAIAELPSVQPERKKGKWILSKRAGFICSECRSGYRDQPTLMGKPMFVFCPLCGCEMER